MALSLEIPREVLEEYTRVLRRRIVGVSSRPVSLVVSHAHHTASTDTVRVVNFPITPLLKAWAAKNGQIEAAETGETRGVDFWEAVARGMATHEALHLLFSHIYGGELMAWAAKTGEKIVDSEGNSFREALTTIMNLLLDRKDDWRGRQEFPGAASDLNRRLAYIMPRMEMLPPLEPGGPERDPRRENAWSDFFFACKGFSRPRHEAVWRCKKVILKKLPNFTSVKVEDFQECALAILEILRKADPENRPTKARMNRAMMSHLLSKLEKLERGEAELTEEDVELLQAVIEKIEAEEETELFPIKSDVKPSPRKRMGEVGMLDGEPEEIEIEPNPAAAEKIMPQVAHLVLPLRERLVHLARPRIIIHRGLQQGDIDEDALAPLLIGSEDVYLEREIRRRELTAALCVDRSGSMGSYVGEESSKATKMSYARQLAVAFNWAFENVPNCSAWSWTYEEQLESYGPANRHSGIAGARSDGGNRDTWMAKRLQRYFAENPADTQVVFWAADGGPDSFENLHDAVRELQAMNVISVLFFIENGDYEDDQCSEVMDWLRRIHDYVFVFDGERIDQMLKQFGDLALRLYR